MDWDERFRSGEYPTDPEKDAELAVHLGGSAERVKDAEMTSEERAVWLFEANTKALAAALEAAGARGSDIERGATDDSLGELKDALGGGF